MIGLFLITHTTYGESLIQCACHVLNRRPEQLAQLGVALQDDPLDIMPLARDMLQLVDTGEGVLIMTDLYGATPSNIATKLLKPGQIEGVAGVNLPMLLRALTYRDKGMETLITRAVAGGVTACSIYWTTDMPQAEAEIVNKLGLHARASAKLTQLAGSFPCEVWMEKNGRRINAKSIMGVMMLAAGKGSKVMVTTSGEQEDEALQSLLQLIADRFGEAD